MNKITNKRLDDFSSYIVYRNNKFAIGRTYTKEFRKYYIRDLVEPFITLLSGVGMVLISPIQLIANVWDMMPSIYI